MNAAENRRRLNLERAEGGRQIRGESGRRGSPVGPVAGLSGLEVRYLAKLKSGVPGGRKVELRSQTGRAQVLA